MCPFLCYPQSLLEVTEMLQSVFITNVFSLSHSPDLEEKVHYSSHAACQPMTYTLLLLLKGHLSVRIFLRLLFAFYTSD